MAYLNAWLTSFVGYTLLCSLLGWTTRGRHHTPVSVCLTVWPLHRDFSLLVCEKWSELFYVHRVWLSYTRDRRLKVHSERLVNEDKAPYQRALLPWRDLTSINLNTLQKWSIQTCLLEVATHVLVRLKYETICFVHKLLIEGIIKDLRGDKTTAEMTQVLSQISWTLQSPLQLADTGWYSRRVTNFREWLTLEF